MGLKLDIKNAFLESMSYEDMPVATDDDVDTKNAMDDVVDKLADNLRDSIIDFLTKQTFRITQMKAILEVEKIETMGPRFADVLPIVQSTVPPGQTTVGMSVSGGPTTGATSSPTVATVTTGTKGVLLPKLSLKKMGGQGGVLTAQGNAYIGPNPVGSTNEKKTKVQLLKNEIKGAK